MNGVVKNFRMNQKKYEYNSKLVFHEHTKMSYYTDIIQIDININDFIALTLEGESLSELEDAINLKKKGVYESDVIVFFLKELYNLLETVCVIKIYDEEIIHNKYRIDDAKEAIDVFINSLDWNNPKGIVITKKN